MPTIRILDRERILDVEHGAPLMQSMDDAGTLIMHACGGNCICGTCNVEVVEGAEYLAPAAEAEQRILGKLKREGGGLRLSCQVRVTGDIAVRIAPMKS